MIIHCTIFHTINTDIFEYKFYQFYNMVFFCIKTESKKKKIPTKYINEIIMKFLCKKFHPKRWMIYIVCLGGMKHPYRFNLGSDIWDQLLKHQEAISLEGEEFILSSKILLKPNDCISETQIWKKDSFNTCFSNWNKRLQAQAVVKSLQEANHKI